MKLGDLKPDNPWFQTEETRALVAWAREQREMAMRSLMGKIRANEPQGGALIVGEYDAYGRVLTMIQEGK